MDHVTASKRPYTTAKGASSAQQQVFVLMKAQAGELSSPCNNSTETRCGSAAPAPAAAADAEGKR